MAALAEAPPLSTTDAAAVRRQLTLLLANDLLRTSKRSVAFLRYIVQETLDGRANDLKERTIGVNVFGKALTYDTSLDHVVRTAASELRRRLSLYYAQQEHRSELQILLLPGSYVPQFRAAHGEPSSVGAAAGTVETSPEAATASQPPLAEELRTAEQISLLRESSRGAAPVYAKRSYRRLWLVIPVLSLVVCGLAVLSFTRHAQTRRQRFWEPLLATSGPVLIAVGDVPSGPPVTQEDDADLFSISPASPGPPRVPFADTVTVARVTGTLAGYGKEVTIRREDASSFADLRERPVVLVGAFNNAWSLQLTRGLRFSLAVDRDRKLLYIRDRQHPETRGWAWSVGPHPAEHNRDSSTPLHDYALVTRILDSQTGHDVVVVGGLYAYGTQAAGEFLGDRDLRSLPSDMALDVSHKRLQIVLDTVVTDGTPGPPQVVAVSVE